MVFNIDLGSVGFALELVAHGIAVGCPAHGGFKKDWRVEFWMDSGSKFKALLSASLGNSKDIATQVRQAARTKDGDFPTLHYQ